MPITLIPVLIGFKRKPLDEDKNLIIRHQGQIKYIYTLIDVIAAKLPQAAIDALKRNPNIEYVEIDERVFKCDTVNYTATNYTTNTKSIQTGEIYPMDIEILQQIVPWGIEKIGANLVHPYTKGFATKVAAIDTGIDYNHPDLLPNYKGGFNFVSDTPDPMDDNGHGTHIAGTIAAADNDIGVIGVAPEAYLYAVKVLDSIGSGYISDVIAGIQWAVNNYMRIANMSLGSRISNRSLKSACDNAYNQGLLLIAAAGNSGNAHGTGNNVDYPARYDSVIAVAATDINDTRAFFSSTGPAVELSAPGVNINSTLRNNRYGTASGTSMATPHVTGTAALIMAYDPSLTNVQTRIRMQITATDLGNPGKDNLYGYGLVNAASAIFSLS